MNPVVVIHFLAAALVIVAAVPLIRRKVGMNPWYGVRIPAAFASSESWFDLNQYGGRLLLRWGCSIAVVATVGAFLPRNEWIAYDWIALVVILGGLAIVGWRIMVYAGNRPKV